MLDPIITEYIAADRTDEARRQAARARRARQVRTETRQVRATRRGPQAGPSRRWRAGGWALTPRAFGLARLLPR